MVPLAVDGIQLDVAEGIVHPAHVPLEGEAQPALALRLGHHGIGVAFLGDGHGPGEIMPHGGVELLQEGDGIQVFPPAVGVGQPLLPFAAEVVVQHGADRVHPQSVGVEPVQPEAGVAQKERAHLAPPEVEHTGAPLGHFAPPGVGMLKAGRAVKPAQPCLVPGEMGGHPVKDHADARLMAPVDKGHQVVGRAVAGGGGIVAGHLIAPGHVEGMLHHGEQLDMGVAHVQHIGNQLVGRLAVGQHAAGLILAVAHQTVAHLGGALPPPGTQVHLIDVHGAALTIPCDAAAHPVRILPGIALQVVQAGGGVRTVLHREAEWVSLLMPCAVRAKNGELIGFQLLLSLGIIVFLLIGRRIKGGCRQTNLPRAVILLCHGTDRFVPLAEFAHQGHLSGVGRPHGKVPHGNAVLLHRMGPQHLICAAAVALMEPLPHLRTWCDIAHGCTCFPSFFRFVRDNLRPLAGFILIYHKTIVPSFVHFRQGVR